MNRESYDRRTAQLRKMLDSDTPMVVVALQCWLVLVSYCGGKWAAIGWTIARTVGDMELRTPRWLRRRV